MIHLEGPYQFPYIGGLNPDPLLMSAIQNEIFIMGTDVPTTHVSYISGLEFDGERVTEFKFNNGGRMTIVEDNIDNLITNSTHHITIEYAGNNTISLVGYKFNSKHDTDEIKFFKTRELDTVELSMIYSLLNLGSLYSNELPDEFVKNKDLWSINTIRSVDLALSVIEHYKYADYAQDIHHLPPIEILYDNI